MSYDILKYIFSNKIYAEHMFLGHSQKYQPDHITKWKRIDKYDIFKLSFWSLST